ncbi:hypothetical protein FM120_08105 [Sphingobacterium faecium PCAi_F2.5]|nr:hypothetical protein FM120_08105 [Sphingobacterium faecium PCAi_F2.5]
MLKQHSGAYAEYDKYKIDHFELENTMNGRSYLKTEIYSLLFLGF